MTTFEYIEECANVAFRENPDAVDGGDYYTIPITTTQLNTLGKQGWQAISIHRNEHGDIRRVLLMRTKRQTS